MEEHSQLVDICVVCALPDEVRAFLEIVRQQCNVDFEELIDPQHKYDYRLTTIENDRGEPLALHVSWLPRYGPQEMVWHLQRVLEEYQPRIAIMTGICAGDSQQVQLGDLIVAERTFTYDNGKFTFDEQGRSVHLHDTMTYQLDANILQFLGLFDKWKPLIAYMERPLSVPEQREIACHLKPMASGSAVRGDQPFEEVRAPVRGTVAIDMEGAAFGLVMSHHPLIRWLVVKGVCDYADRDKNDAYHDYAARTSALYALSFLRAYVTNERLPRPDGHSPSIRAGPPRVWNVPHARNPHFTGRDDLLDRLHQQLTPTGQSNSATNRRVALTQPLAIKGLGGIGKTQIAVEYAYRSREQRHYTHTLWVNAAAEETILTSFVAIAEVLPAFAANNETDHQKLVEAVKRWLEQCEHPWLLVFDNVDNADDLPLIQQYLPQRGNGSVLLTTRAHAVGSLAVSIEVEKMGLMEGVQLLLHRAQRKDHASDEEINEATNVVIALDCFPLALDQAGAYIEETRCSFVDYLQMYQARRRELHARRGFQTTNYPNSVATTWSLSFQKVEQANPAAAELLRLCAFLAPDNIPEELIRDGAVYWSLSLQHAAADLFAFNQMIEELLKFSLVQRLVETHMLSIHRLVQAVQIDAMEPEVQRQWAERVIQAVNKVFPHDADDVAMWPLCLRYLGQAQACNALIEQYMLSLVEAAHLLSQTGFYLRTHALYDIAEPLHQRALSIYESQLGSNHPYIAISLNNLAGLYQDQGKFELAEPLLKRALQIDERQSGSDTNWHSLMQLVRGLFRSLIRPLVHLKIAPQKASRYDHPDTATSLNNLALLYKSQGKFELAEPLLERALSIHEQHFGPDHPRTATSLNNLADLYESQGKYKLAEPLFERALAICEQQLGPDHPHTATSLNNLALLYKSQGKFELAKPLLERALSIHEQHFGPDHPNTATSLNNLAHLYENQKKYELAEPLFKRALSIDEKVYGRDHSEVTASLNNLASLYHDQGKYELAEALFKRALQIDEQQLGPDHPDTATNLNNLASLYHDQGKYELAEPLFRRALQIREQQLGPDHPSTATSFNNLAGLYQDQREYELAEPLFKRNLAIDEKVYGRDHSKVATALCRLAELYKSQGKYELAESLLERALSIDEKVYGRDHSEIVNDLYHLASLYQDQRKYELAELLFKRALAICEQQLGATHLNTALYLNNIASLYDIQGRYAEAEPLYQRSLAICEGVLGPEHPNTQTVSKNYTFSQAMRRDGEAKKLEEES